MEELWKEIIETDCVYSISNLGRVRNNNTGKIRKLRKDSKGYCRLTFKKYNGKKDVVITIHRLVARYFLERDDHRNFVNHKNGVKTDNRSCNLEWCTPKENVHHSLYELGNIKLMSDMCKQRLKDKHPRSIPVVCYVDDAVYNFYVNARECAKELGLNEGNLSTAINNNKPIGKYYVQRVF